MSERSRPSLSECFVFSLVIVGLFFLNFFLFVASVNVFSVLGESSLWGLIVLLTGACFGLVFSISFVMILRGFD